MNLGFDPEKITYFARTNARGQDVQFGIKAKDRQKHMYVIGKTGMGKSTLLENMAAQDIQSGEGMAFIDPHGSAIETLLEYVPEDRLDDVVYFAPFDMNNPIAFNIMEDVGIDTRHLVVSGLMSTFKKIWEDAWSARMEYILTNALLALIEYPDTTLLSVNRMLADKVYRDKVIDYVKDPAVKAYWVDEFNNYTERFAAEALPAIQNKIGQFTGNPLIRNIIGQPKSSFDVRKMMDEKKILLVNLSKGLVGETNADLLGSMLITKIYLAAMSRAELPPAQMKQMPNFYFYVDEFQSFANSTFANILSEARKYHLNLIIAHQYVAQMEEPIRDAVFGNVGTTVSFRVGPFDAETLEPIFEPQFLANDLVNLGFTQIYLTLSIDGVGSQPFSASTLPPIETPPQSHKHMVIKRSQQNYCQSREVVEKIVTDLHTPDDRIEASEKGEGANAGGFTKPSGFFKVGTDKEFVKQKERLKSGLPRQKGPAQTPPGTGKDTSKTQKPDQPARPTTNKKPDQPRTADQTRKPEPVRKPKPESAPQKTPEELRAVLAQMAGKEKKTDKKPTEATPKKDPAAASKPAVGDSKHKADLQAVLAGVVAQQPETKPATESKKVTPAATSKKPASPKPQTNKPTSQHKPTKPTPATQSNAVIASLRQTFDATASKPGATQPNPNSKQVSNQNDAADSVPKQIVNSPSKPRPDTTKPADTDTLVRNVFTPKAVQAAAQTNNEASRIRKVTVERRPQVQVQMGRTSAPPAAESATAPVAVGSERQTPAFTPVRTSTEPDLSTVKKMLRHSGNERLPGMN